MREKPIKLASKLKTIRQRLALSQTEMKKRLGFQGHYGRLSEVRIRTPPAKCLNALALCASGGNYHGGKCRRRAGIE